MHLMKLEQKLKLTKFGLESVNNTSSKGLRYGFRNQVDICNWEQMFPVLFDMLRIIMRFFHQSRNHISPKFGQVWQIKLKKMSLYYERPKFEIMCIGKKKAVEFKIKTTCKKEQKNSVERARIWTTMHYAYADKKAIYIKTNQSNCSAIDNGIKFKQEKIAFD